jgi:AcrR family transcriptional regulator
MARISSTDRRRALIDAALRVIGRDGVHAATTRAIVAEAEMSLASFHYVFRSRDDMMRALVASLIETQTLAALASLTESSDIRRALRAGLQAYFDVLTANPQHEQALIELVLHSLRTDDLADLPRLQYENYHRAVADLLVLAASRANIFWTLPVADIARTIVTITDGVTLAWLADRETEASGRVLDFAADSLALLAQPLTPQASPGPRPDATPTSEGR